MIEFEKIYSTLLAAGWTVDWQLINLLGQPFELGDHHLPAKKWHNGNVVAPFDACPLVFIKLENLVMPLILDSTGSRIVQMRSCAWISFYGTDLRTCKGNEWCYSSGASSNHEATASGYGAIELENFLLTL